MDNIKVSVAKKVMYVALNKVTGLTDLLLQPYDEAGVAFGSPIAFVELANGAYEASFTPDAVGTWRVRVSSIVNGDDAIKSFEVVTNDLADIISKVDVIDGIVDSIKTETDKIQTIDNNIDTIKIETDKIQTIDDNVDSVKTTVESNATKLDTIVLSVKSGGYFA